MTTKSVVYSIKCMNDVKLNENNAVNILFLEYKKKIKKKIK